jgi:cell division protein FtsB
MSSRWTWRSGRERRSRVERECVAGRAKERKRAQRRKAAPRIGRRRLRLLWAIALVGVAVYLYYRPIASYVETRNDLTTRRAEVESLRLVRAELELRLVNSTSVGSLEREARRINYVKPGERLFVVKGIPAWRKARSPGTGRP